MKFELPTGGAVYIPDADRTERINKLSDLFGAALKNTDVRALVITWHCMDAYLWYLRVTGHMDLAATAAREFESLPWPQDTRSDEQTDADAKAMQEVFDNVLGLKKAWDNNGSDLFDADSISIAFVVLASVIYKLIGGLFSQEAADRFHKQFTAASERSLEKVVSMAVRPTQEGLN